MKKLVLSALVLVMLLGLAGIASADPYTRVDRWFEVQDMDGLDEPYNPNRDKAVMEGTPADHNAADNVFIGIFPDHRSPIIRYMLALITPR